ncbi:hypothetical protein GTQ99_02385 [Kineococcus sp. T13]|uniref:hypothetical protein n=1 Tax=Kineococcus vitellinus TaxID=2696565 RepID=UPI001411D92E|nr:hypothetical protein [Kineococcus vitellinus]NAZ74276.1 hypothetical protein [Kineococcus vitellinus]
MRLQQALAAPGRRVRLISPDNTSPGTVATVHAAWRKVNDPHSPAATFAIELRAGLVAADVDLDGVDGDVATHQLLTWCRAQGIRAVFALSGQPGHAHVYAAVAPQQRTAFGRYVAKLVPSSQLREGGSLIRPPGAPHRLPGLPPSRLDSSLSIPEVISLLGLDQPASTATTRRSKAGHAHTTAATAGAGTTAHSTAVTAPSAGTRRSPRGTYHRTGQQNAVSKRRRQEDPARRRREQDTAGWQRLAVPAPRPARLRRRRTGRGDLSAEQWMLARDAAGPLVPRGRDGRADESRMLWILACACWANGLSEDWFTALATNRRMAGCRHAWRRSARAKYTPERWARGTYRRVAARLTQLRAEDAARAGTASSGAGRPRDGFTSGGDSATMVATVQAEDLLGHLARVRAAAERYPWGVQERPGVLAHLQAHCLIALQAGTAEGYGASERQLQQLALQLGRHHARGARRKLQEAGFLMVVEVRRPQPERAGEPAGALAEAFTPHCYRLTVPQETGDGGSGVNVVGPLPARFYVVDGASVGHELWSERAARIQPEAVEGGGIESGHVCHTSDTSRRAAAGLGKRAWLVYGLLHQPSTLTQLAEAAGMSACGMRTVLRRLHAHGLATMDGTRWLRGPATLDQVATTLGVNSVTERLATRIREERQAWEQRWLRHFNAPAEVVMELGATRAGHGGVRRADGHGGSAWLDEAEAERASAADLAWYEAAMASADAASAGVASADAASADAASADARSAATSTSKPVPS